MKKLRPGEPRGLFTHRCRECRVKVRISIPDGVEAGIDTATCFLCGAELEPLSEEVDSE